MKVRIRIAPALWSKEAHFFKEGHVFSEFSQVLKLAPPPSYVFHLSRYLDATC